MTGLSHGDVLAQAEALQAAADASPVLQIAGPLRARAAEWRKAGRHLLEATEMDLAAEVVLLGTLDPGVTVFAGGRPAEIIRVLHQGGQVSLHVQNSDDGRADYVNFVGGNSAPVVVL